MNPLKRLIMNNQAWVKEKTTANPAYFANMKAGQQPHTLWIGCADSRVPAEDITGSQPGELFVSRNVANVFSQHDQSAMSVLEYACLVLKVNYIVVCGHTGCGGLQAVLTGCDLPHTSGWLDVPRKTRDFYAKKLDDIPSLEDRVMQLAKYNVHSGVKRIAQTDIVKSCWENGQWPVITGWLYHTFTGELEQLVSLDSVSGASRENLMNPEDLNVLRN